MRCVRKHLPPHLQLLNLPLVAVAEEEVAADEVAVVVAPQCAL